MLREGRPVGAIANATGLSVKEIRSFRDGLADTEKRWTYSRIYYARHPDRPPGQWYPVEDGDPDLPDVGISVRERHT